MELLTFILMLLIVGWSSRGWAGAYALLLTPPALLPRLLGG